MSALLMLSGLGSTLGAAPLTEADKATWIALYEEEILAHDLYVELGKLHPGIRPFQNIPRSEARHRDAIGAVLKAEGITVPKAAEGRRFVSKGLDDLYAKLLKKGRKSEKAACMVGVSFEETDIADLRAARKQFPAHAELLGQLEFASGNHLRAFHANLSSRGGKYRPKELAKADFQAILAGKGPEGVTSCGDCGKDSACKGNCGDGAACKGGACKGDCEGSKKAGAGAACKGDCASGDCQPKGQGPRPGKGRGQGPPPGRGPNRAGR